MKKLKTVAVSLSLLWGAASVATPISGTSLQNALTGLGAVVNVQTDQYGLDQTWHLGGTGIAVNRIQFEFSAYSSSNSFGIYDLANPSTQLTIFSGADAPGAAGFLLNLAGSQFCAMPLFGATTCANFSSTSFGFFLNGPAGTFYSQKLLNGDGVDHMVAYAGGPAHGNINGNPWLANEYLLAWEDLNGGGDRDYDDFVVLVESVIGVPEPATIAILGLGLLGMAIVTRRRSAQRRS